MNELEFAISLMEVEYGKTIAKRSKQPYMKHIHDGVKILRYMEADYDAACAFAVHPIFQINDLFERFMDSDDHECLHKLTIIYAMHYREVANAYLPRHYIGAKDRMPVILLPAVKDMLIADKVQNWSDCQQYQSPQEVDRLEGYFNNWLNYLEVDGPRFTELAMRM